MFTDRFIEKFETRVWDEGALSMLSKLGWTRVGTADMGDEYFLWHKLRLELPAGSEDISVKRAALTSVALQVGELTYSQEETPADENVQGAFHIYIRVDKMYWSAIDAAEAAEKMAKYGCMSCSECKHQFDNWTMDDANGGRRKRAVVSDPLERDTYRVLPCESCPVQFRDEFESRMAQDKAKLEALKMRWPDYGVPISV